MVARENVIVVTQYLNWKAPAAVVRRQPRCRLTPIEPSSINQGSFGRSRLIVRDEVVRFVQTAEETIIMPRVVLAFRMTVTPQPLQV